MGVFRVFPRARVWGCVIYVLLFSMCIRDNTSSLLSDSLSVPFRRWLNEKMEKQCVEVIYGELLDASVGYSILAICFFIENLLGQKYFQL